MALMFRPEPYWQAFAQDRAVQEQMRQKPFQFFENLNQTSGNFANDFITWKRQKMIDDMKQKMMFGYDVPKPVIYPIQGNGQKPLFNRPNVEHIPGEMELARNRDAREQALNEWRMRPEVQEPVPMGTQMSKPMPQTPAQSSADRAFGTEYAKYVAGGGYADVMNQINSLDSVLSELEGGKKNMTGSVVGLQPDWLRKRTNPGGFSAQQSVEQSIQRSLRQTLGAQFTESEGRLFMQRGYDPALPEAENAKKLRSAINQLKMMAAAKQEAVDYYEQNGTLTGFKGTFYTIKNGEMVRASKDDFYRMMDIGGQNPPSSKTIPSQSNKPKTIKQNGVIYTLNEATGQYE